MRPDELFAREPSTAMVVDDDPGINRLLQVRLKSLGYTVSSATNGEEALAALDELLPDLLLLDVSMPGIDGLEVLEFVRSRQLDIAVVMTTAFGSEQVAIDALRRGADDYLRKPFEPGEFRTVVDRTTSQLYLRRQNHALRNRLDAELFRASGIQLGLLPDALPSIPGYTMAGRCVPASAPGGDFFDWRLQPGGACSITLGDVMGKGMPAALLMTTVHAALRSVAVDKPPGVSIRSVQRALATDLERSRSFVAIFHALITPKTGELAYVDAGHGLTMLTRGDGTLHEIAERGLPLGVADEDDLVEGRAVLYPGDTLLIASDGLLDAHPDRHVTLETSSRLIREAASIEAAADRLMAYAKAEGPVEDDVTFIIIHRQDPESG